MLAMVAVVLCGPLWFTDRLRPALLAPAPRAVRYHLARPDHRVVWQSLLRIGEQQSYSSDVGQPSDGGVRVMFLGDSITDGGAAGTAHPRKHPNGSCSYRFSFLSHITSGAVPHRRDETPNPKSHSRKLLRPEEVTTVGPFASNCGDVVVPDKCFKILRDAWGNADGLGLTESNSASIRWRQHAAVSGVTALGLIRHNEAAQKRNACYEKSGILTTAPSLPPAVVSMEQQYRETYPLRVNTSDVAVWAAAYEPHLAMVLIGTNDLRWGRPWREILYESIPAILHELLWYADPSTSPLLGKSTRRPQHVLRGGQGRGYASSICPTFAVLSTLYPRAEFESEIDSLNEALLTIQKKRQLGNRVMCPAHDTFLDEHVLRFISGETFLLCHPCIRVIDGGAPVSKKGGGLMPKKDFVASFTFDGLHPNDEGDEQLGQRMAHQLMNL